MNYKINIDKWGNELYNNINRSNIKIFTYEEILKFQQFTNDKYRKNIDIVKEESEKYTLNTEKINEKKINNEDDKVCRKMLDIKIEASEFINKKLNINLKPEQLEKYNRSFVTSDFENRESDIVYRIKGKNIFFIIEHQTKKDASMPWRMAEYATEIIKSAIDYRKINQKNYKLPLVIPIVIYTGKTKWDIETYISEKQEKLEEYKNLEFGKYIIEDVNNYTEEELLKEKTYLSKFMIIEKYKKGSNLSVCLDNIVKEINENKDEYEGKGKEVLMLMISKILKEKVGDEKVKELMKKLKGEDVEMLQILETIREENEDLRKEGRLAVAKKLLKMKMPLKQIIDVTELTEKEIKSIQV